MSELAQQIAAARKAWLDAAAAEQCLCSTGPTNEWLRAQDATRAARREYDRLLLAEEVA